MTFLSHMLPDNRHPRVAGRASRWVRRHARSIVLLGGMLVVVGLVVRPVSEHERTYQAAYVLDSAVLNGITTLTLCPYDPQAHTTTWGIMHLVVLPHISILDRRMGIGWVTWEGALAGGQQIQLANMRYGGHPLTITADQIVIRADHAPPNVPLCSIGK